MKKLFGKTLARAATAFTALALALVFTACDTETKSSYISYGTLYSSSGFYVNFENGYVSDTVGAFTDELSYTYRTLESLSVSNSNLKGTISWTKAYSDSSFSNEITDWTKYYTIKTATYKDYSLDSTETTQEGYSYPVNIYVKDSDLTIKATEISLSVYNYYGTLLASKTKEDSWSITDFAESMEDWADSTHYITKYYKNSLMTDEVTFPLSVADVFANNYKLYATQNECTDKSYFTRSSYSGVSLSSSIPNSVSSITVPPSYSFDDSSSYTASTDKSNTLKDFSSLYITSMTFKGDYDEIAYSCFNGNTALKSISGLDSIKTVGSYAFYGCTSIASISLPAVATISDYAFGNCGSLTSFDLPISVTSIGRNAFPSTVTTINYAGTKAQWKAGVKLSYYSSSSYSNETTSEAYLSVEKCASFESGTKIVCTDGTLTYTMTTSSTTVTES